MNDEPLTMEKILKLHGELQRRMLRDTLGDRLIGSPYIPRGEAVAIAPDGVDVPRARVGGEAWEQAAEILKAGGTLVVSKEWLDE